MDFTFIKTNYLIILAKFLKYIILVYKKLQDFSTILAAIHLLFKIINLIKY